MTKSADPTRAARLAELTARMAAADALQRMFLEHDKLRDKPGPETDPARKALEADIEQFRKRALR